MTPELLKQAREAAQAVIDRWETPLWKDAEPTANVIARLREVVSALTAFDSLSEYDKAVHALAPYLPEWVCFVAYEEGRLRMFGEYADPFFLEPVWGMTSAVPDPNYDGEHIIVKDFKFFEVPKPHNTHQSLRRITHNSDGTVTVERG